MKISINMIMRSKTKLLQCYYRNGNNFLIKRFATMYRRLYYLQTRKHQADFPYRGIRQGHTGCCTQNN